MDVIPAIDLLDGAAVRLVQGDYERRAASVGDPGGVAAEWARAGAPWLHIVDLGGARAGHPEHLELAASLVQGAKRAAPGVRTELGGGLRRLDDIAAALDSGIDVAILGTAAVEDHDLLAAAASRWPGRIAVSIDVRGDRVALDGWTRSTATDVVELTTRVARAGIAHLIVTDVQRDGTRGGPNADLLSRVREALPQTRLVAAGGIGAAEDLVRLARIGIDGAVVGLALVDGSLSIGQALEAAGAA